MNRHRHRSAAPTLAAILAAAALSVAAASGAVFAPPPDDAAELVAKLRKKYDRIRDLSLSFTQTTVFAVSKAVQSSEGALAMGKGNRYRITLEDRLIVCDGSTVWSWSKAGGQVIVDRFRDDPAGLTPERLLARIPAEYLPAQVGEEKVGKREAVVIRMTPPERDRSMRWFKIWVDEDRLTILRLQVADLAGNETTYDLRDLAIDGGLPDSTFRLDAPEGTEVLDLR